MPSTLTHALVPFAAAGAFGKQATPRRLVIAAAIAAAAPEADWLIQHLWRLPATSPFPHSGAIHSLFAALAAGLLGASLHKALRARPLTAGVVIAAAVASHGILDMMTDSGEPVAYLWPLSSVRLWADWRPIHSGPVHFAQLLSQGLMRLRSETLQLILPMFAAALAIRASSALLKASSLPRQQHQLASLRMWEQALRV